MSLRFFMSAQVTATHLDFRTFTFGQDLSNSQSFSLTSVRDFWVSVFSGNIFEVLYDNMNYIFFNLYLVRKLLEIYGSLEVS